MRLGEFEVGDFVASCNQYSEVEGNLYYMFFAWMVLERFVWRQTWKAVCSESV